MVKIHSHKQRDRNRVVQQESSVVQLLNACPVCPMRLFYGYNLIFCLCFIVSLVQNVYNFIKPGNVMLSVLGIEIENANHAHTIINMRRAIKWSPTHHTTWNIHMKSVYWILNTKSLRSWRHAFVIVNSMVLISQINPMILLVLNTNKLNAKNAEKKPKRNK